MMSKNPIVPFSKDCLIKFLTRPFLLNTNENIIKISAGIFSEISVVCVTFAWGLAGVAGFPMKNIQMNT